MTNEFEPTADLATLQVRSRLLTGVREFFAENDIWEVETPLLSVDTVVDRFIEPISVSLQHRQLWLQTSPEFGMKRLLAAGSGSIFQVTRAFRGGEIGPLHNPEFTIVEWYVVDQSYEEGIDFLANFAKRFLAADDIDRLSYEQAFLQFAGIDPHRCKLQDLIDCADLHERTIVPETLVRATAQVESSGGDRDEWLNLLLCEIVEPNLGLERPVILYDYPASQAALAKIDTTNQFVAQRFELYYQGVELANGYHELQDAEELKRRIQSTNAFRQSDNRRRLPSDSYLIDAMEHGLPRCTGVALGFDRLVMLAEKLGRISEVIPFPIDRA